MSFAARFTWLVLLASLILAPGCGGGSSGNFEGSLAADTKVSASTPAGTTIVRDPAICCVGRRVHAAWVDERTGQGDVYVNTSTNGTQTWLGSDIRVNTDNPGAAPRQDPVICCTGTKVVVVWTDFRDDAPQIRSNYSWDAGRTFDGLDLRVSVNLAITFTNRDPQICCDGDDIFVVWSQDDTGAIFFNRSLNAGGTWIATPRRLDTGAGNCTRPSICCDGGRLVVAWEDTRNGATDIYSNFSLNSGATWSATNPRIDTDAAGSAPSTHPKLCCEAGRVFCAWRDQRAGGETVYANHSSNSGQNWQRADTRIDTSAVLPNEVESHAIGCVKNYVHIVWTDDRNGEPDVFHRRSLNSGIDWEAPDTRIDAGTAGATASTEVDLCVNIPHVYATWSEETGTGFSDWWIVYSTDNGAIAASSPLQMNDTPPDSTTATEGALCCDGGDVFGVWVDSRDAAITPLADIYSRGSK